MDALTKIRMHALLTDLVARHRPAVLMITHDVDEAIALADRVVVLTGGRLSLELTTDGTAGTGTGEIRARLLSEFGVEPVARSWDGDDHHPVD